MPSRPPPRSAFIAMWRPLTISGGSGSCISRFYRTVHIAPKNLTCYRQA